MSNSGEAENKATAAPDAHRPRETQWFTTLWHLHLHVFALYALVLLFTEAKWATVAFATVIGVLCMLGVTAGAHRLWAHRSYSAALPLRFFLLLCQTASGTGSAYNWVLEHRIHHKFHGTDSDPFNYKRGFLYSHILSRSASKPENWADLVREIDMSDIEADSLLMFQKRFYWLLVPVCAFLTPVNVPVELWNESIFTSAMLVFVLRFVIVTHLTWLISSGINIWALRPENNYSSDSNLVFFVNMSMWPHYHYLLPWDYQTDEYASYGNSCTTSLIRAWAAVGWASELRTVDTAGVRAALERAVREGRPLVACVEDAGRDYSERIQKDHLLQRAPQFF